MQDFEMSQVQLETLKDMIKSPPVIAIHCTNPRSRQEVANSAWQHLGIEMGFDFMTVTPNGQGDRFFSAVSMDKCKGIELGDGNFSGCDASHGDCPSCGN